MVDIGRFPKTLNRRALRYGDEWWAEFAPKESWGPADTLIKRRNRTLLRRHQESHVNHPQISREPKMNILIVDDSSAMRMMVVRTLRQAGIDKKCVEQAEDGAIALELIRKKVPDLVLADWNMPNMTGIELLEALRAEDIDVTFGFITTESSTEMRKRATDAGAQFLISKPFTLEAFEKVLATVVK